MPHKLCVVLLFLLAYKLPAQPVVNGLGRYIIGLTTPDSLKGTDFTEENPSYVKGTIALVCTHIRTFRAPGASIEAVEVPDIYLFFYDNILFRISCQYTKELATAFVLTYGKGIPAPPVNVSLCARHPTHLMQIGREVWQHGDVAAQAVHASGYTTTCELAEENRLTIESHRFATLSSDCELKNTYRFIESVEKMP